MAIRKDAVTSTTVRKLMDEPLSIPPYQRPYRWSSVTALQLLEDVKAAQESSTDGPGQYVLGAVILHDNNGALDVVDGQQRLLTLRMLRALLDPSDSFRLDPVAGSPVGLVWTALTSRLPPEGQRQELLDFLLDRCFLFRVVTDDVDEAFRVFDSQNYRGKPLAPHDLLKAHHLRAMGGESEALKSAIVEQWEDASEEELDRLFSIYLYRITRWSKGLRAPSFTAHEIGVFKGIEANSTAPARRYHIAAQTVLPVVDALTREGQPTPDTLHARFQLDAPIVAGRPFFEMVAFMLDELVRLRAEAFPEPSTEFTSSRLIFNDEDPPQVVGFVEMPGRSRYRRVSELYLATLLYLVNKCGSASADVWRDDVFRWSYAPRVALWRVQQISLDKRAAGEEVERSPFVLLRDSFDPRVLLELDTKIQQRSPEHEITLAELLTTGLTPQ